MKKLPKIGIGSRLFLTAVPNLEIGTRLPSGHWREKVYSQLIEKVDLYDSMEFIWEIVRLREFPHLPSRIDSRFLWADESIARSWHYGKNVRDRINRGNDSRRTKMTIKAKEILASYQQIHDEKNLTGLYEVEVVELKRVCTANGNLISYHNKGDTVATLMERARQYWRGQGVDRHGEVLLEGTVAVRRNLFALQVEEIEAVKDKAIGEAISAALCWAEWRHGRVPDSYIHHSVLTADAHLPMRVVGWLVVRLEEGSDPVRCESQPVLIQPGERIEISSNLPHLHPGTHYQPVLFCDRSAAHYWQLNPYWEGEIEGEWQVIKESP